MKNNNQAHMQMNLNDWKAWKTTICTAFLHILNAFFQPLALPLGLVPRSIADTTSFDSCASYSIHSTSWGASSSPRYHMTALLISQSLW